MQRIAISSSALGVILAAAARAPGVEVCGLLTGAGDRIDRAIETANVASNPARHFEIDPAALFTALRAERSGGPRLIGYWHSHPSGDPAPSVTDAAMADADGRIWMIAAGGEVSAWRAVASGAVHDRFDRVDWIACEDQPSLAT